MTKRPPNPHERPKLVSIEKRAREVMPSEQARFRAATVRQDQREGRARREALALMAAAESRPQLRDEPTMEKAVEAIRATRSDPPTDSIGVGGWGDLPPTCYDDVDLPTLGLGRMLSIGFIFAAGFLAGLIVGRS